MVFETENKKEINALWKELTKKDGNEMKQERDREKKKHTAKASNAIWATRGYRLLLRFVVIKCKRVRERERDSIWYENSRQTTRKRAAQILFRRLFLRCIRCDLNYFLFGGIGFLFIGFVSQFDDFFFF